MKKVVNINLGGYPFTIDDDAYATLDNYLQTISRHFRKSEGHEEIVGDIESRMAELFQESISTGQIVSMKEVNKAITKMGTPEEFGVDPDESATMASGARTQTNTKSNYRVGKRLFRDRDDEVISGVAAGLSAYFGFKDPLWFRLGLVALTILTGIFPFVIGYLLLWVIVPPAETASDRLAMRGEAINASNIGRVVEEEMDRFGDKVNQWGDEVNEKYASTKKKALKKGQNREAGFVAPLRKGFIF